MSRQSWVWPTCSPRGRSLPRRFADAVGARAPQLRRVLSRDCRRRRLLRTRGRPFASNDAAAALRADAPAGAATRSQLRRGDVSLVRRIAAHRPQWRDGIRQRLWRASVRVLRGASGGGGERGGSDVGSNPAGGARVRRVRRPERRADSRRCRRWDGNPGGGGPATPPGDRGRPAGTAGNARARTGVPLRAGRGRSMRARRGRLLLVGPGRWRRLCPQERPPRLGSTTGASPSCGIAVRRWTTPADW